MLKTSKAYFCQTVAEGSPLGRITSNLLSQARQSIEALFKRPARSDGVIVKQPLPQQYHGRSLSGGLISQVHANSRELLTKFVERNRTSELVRAMKQRYPWTSAIRTGMWGPRLSTFAFVGVGVAAGAQWNARDSYNLQDPINILELFRQKTSYKEQEPETMVAERILPDESEPEFILNLTEEDNSSEPSFVLLDSLTFEDDDLEVTEEQSAVVASETDLFVQSEICESSEPLFRISDEEEKILCGRLQKSLLRVEEQRAELSRVRASVEQLKGMLQELVGPSAEQDPSIICIEPSLTDFDVIPAEGNMKMKLVRTLVVIGQQQSQLTVLRQQLSLLNQQLHQSLQAATERPITIQSSFTKRDACCGPGMTQQM